MMAAMLLCVTVAMHAQATFTEYLATDRPGQGKVTISQSAEIDRVVNQEQPAKKDAPATQPAAKRAASQPSQTASHDKTEEEVRHKTGNGEARTHTNRARHKVRGYRICIFTGGNSKKDKTKAQQMGQKCRELFGELAVYTSFKSPRWVTHVGDFRTAREAQKYVKLIRRAHFTYETRIVASEVNLPY